MSPYYEFLNWLTGQWWYWAAGGVLVVVFFYVAFRRQRP